MPKECLDIANARILDIITKLTKNQFSSIVEASFNGIFNLILNNYNLN